jgi:hypothetical protein
MANDRLVSALKRRFSSPRHALAALGLSPSLLENGDTTMSLSRTAALAAIAALKRRGLIAQDASSEEAERVIHNATETGDRTVRRTRDEMTEEERRHPDAARDALRRAGDAAEIDDETIAELLETLCETHPEVLGSAAQEMGEDRGRGGPRKWAKDRRDMRRARDARMLNARPRRMGADDPPPFRGEPLTGGSMVRDMEDVGYRRDESWPENGGGGMDRRRGRAFDLALDGGDGNAAVAAWLGEQAASIGRL